MRARLALVFASLPFACYLYACSSDDEAEPTDDAGVAADGSSSGSSGDPSPDGSTPRPDGSTPTPDAGDGGPVIPTCPGNPFGDGGAGTPPDGGIALDGGAATVLTSVAGFLDGPQWIDELGGRLVFSDYFAPDLRTVPATPGQSTLLRGNTNTIGSAYAGGVIYSVVAQAGNPSSILRTLPDGGTLAPLALPGVGAANDLVINQGQRIYVTDPC